MYIQRSNRVPLAPCSVHPVINITIIVVKAIPILVHLSLSPRDDDYGPTKAALSASRSYPYRSFVTVCLSVSLSGHTPPTECLLSDHPPTISPFDPLLYRLVQQWMDVAWVTVCLSVCLFVCLSVWLVRRTLFWLIARLIHGSSQIADSSLPCPSSLSARLICSLGQPKRTPTRLMEYRLNWHPKVRTVSVHLSES